ncbi:uncharacterized protein [Palaemon carinicauda]|uniref:uncharacterized protein n=1 Tax=Palaemon carinicauda TaxID=392227 RepID=UPI0035B598A0
MKMEDDDLGSRGMDSDWSEGSSVPNKHSSPSATFKFESPSSSGGSRSSKKKHISHRGIVSSSHSTSRKKLSPYGERKKHSDHHSHKKVRKMEVDDCDVPQSTKREAKSDGKSYAEALAKSVTSGSGDFVRKTERKKRGSSISQAYMESLSSESQKNPSENFISLEENLSSDSFFYKSAFDYTPRKAFDTQEKVSAQVLDRDGTEFDFNVEVYSGDEADPKKPDAAPLYPETPVMVADRTDYDNSYQSGTRLLSPSFDKSVGNTEGLSLLELGMKPMHSTPESHCNGTLNPFAPHWIEADSVDFGTSDVSQGCVADDSFGNRSQLSESSLSRDGQRFFKQSEVKENARHSGAFSVLEKMENNSVSSMDDGAYWNSVSHEEMTSSDRVGGEPSIAVASPNLHASYEYDEIVGPRAENTRVTDSQQQPTKGKSPSEIKKETYRAQMKYINKVIKGNLSEPNAEGRREGAWELNQTFPGTRLRSYFKTEQTTPPSRREHDQGGSGSFKRNLSFEKEPPALSRSHEQTGSERLFDKRDEVSPKWFSGKYEWKPIPSSRRSDDGSFLRPATMPPHNEVLITKEFAPGFIDTHCHLDFLFTRSNHTGTLETYRLKCKDQEAFPKSFEGCVAVFCEPWTFRKISWWEEIISESNIWAAFGCHPHYASRFTEQEECYLKHALQNASVVALGEIGLDYSERNNENPALQQEVFRKQLRIALEFKKPIVIHCRDAHRDCITILKEEVPKDHLIHRHCFTDTLEEAEEWMSAFTNVYLGFTGLVTMMNRRARMVRNVVRDIPLNRILLETDTPYFRPFTSGLSHPGMAIHVAAQIASVKGLGIEEVLKCTRENASKMYGI